MYAVDEIYKDGLQTLDTVVVALCIIVILVVGFVASTFNRGSIDGYFLANRNAHFIPVGLSMFVSNIGTEHFMGIVSLAATEGVVVTLYEIQATLILPILGWFFMPVYIASGVSTMPEYIKLRFGGARIRLTLALLSLLIYMFTKIAAVLYAGSLFVKEILHWDLTASLLLVLVIASLCTISGGMTAVIATDALQAVLMVAGTITLAIFSFSKVGGYNGMLQKYPYAVDPGPPNATNWTVCESALVSDIYMTLWRMSNKSEVPAPGYIGILVLNIWYWCSDQVIVQRCLASKNFTHAKASTILAGFLKFLPMFTLVFPGIIVRIWHPEIVACGTPDSCEAACGQRGGCSNHALPILATLLPHGLRGFFVGVMLAALISSMTSIFNSSSTIVTKDIWIKIRRSASNKEQMLVGRLVVLGIVVISVCWVLVINNVSEDSLYSHKQKATAFLTPSIAAMFIAAMFWSRATEPACFYGLMSGMLMGLVRLAVEYAHVAPLCGEKDPRPDFIAKFHYLYYSIFLFALSGCVIIVVSLLTKPIDPKHLHRLMFSTKDSKDRRVPFSETSESALAREFTEDDLESGLIENDELDMHHQQPENDGLEMHHQQPENDGLEMHHQQCEADTSFSIPNGANNSPGCSTGNRHGSLAADNRPGFSVDNRPGGSADRTSPAYSEASSCGISTIGLGSIPSHDHCESHNFGRHVSGNSKPVPAPRARNQPDSLSIDGDLDMLDLSKPEIKERIIREQSKDAAVKQRVQSYPKYQQAILWVFGIDERVKSAETHIKEAVNLERHKSLKEIPAEKWACDIACLILLGVSIFLHIYWSSTWGHDVSSSDN